MILKVSVKKIKLFHLFLRSKECLSTIFMQATSCVTLFFLSLTFVCNFLTQLSVSLALQFRREKVTYQ